MLPSTQKEDAKELLGLTERKVSAVPRLTWANHEVVIQELCEHSINLSFEERERRWIDWAKDRYLKKVKDEYPDDEDFRTKLNRVVWTGRFRDIATQWLKEKRLTGKKCTLLFC